MQALFLPSSPPPPPRPPRSHKSPKEQPQRRISFKAGPGPHASSPNSASSSTASSRLDVVDLTDSPVPSPASSKAVRVKSPLRPSTPSFISLPDPSIKPKSASTPTSPVSPSSRAGIPHKRPTFILPGDEDSDRDRNRDGEGSSAHDESDDSDRTSFFSTEEFLVSASTVRGAVNAGGTVVDAQREPELKDERESWQSPELHPGRDESREQRAVTHDGDQDAAHGIRRWHALMEVVHTEAGYVRDLRVLVNVYLALLPSLPLSGPAHLAVQELARDAAELLALHERFARALEGASAQAAGGVSPSGSVDEAVRQVACLFIDEASTFDLYKRFCAAQPDAVRLLRPAQARAEWATFEQRCAAGGADVEPESQPRRSESQESGEVHANPSSSTSANGSATSRTVSAPAPAPVSRAKSSPQRTMSLMPSAFKSYASSHRDTPPLQTTEPSFSPRRHSYDSLASVFGASSSGSLRHRSVSSRAVSDSLQTTLSPRSPNSRLRFHDFLIKPVQRICKYPLMLEGLRSRGRGRGGSADAAVASAVESMRAVATRVDEARRRRETTAKSKLIVERTEPHSVATPEFLRSLGDCLLAGSLDVVHHHHISDPITSPVRVKYLGAFLYLGGYLLLVKIGKGKTYRVKHWFSLAAFELVDLPQDIAIVSSSFRLSYMDHHFEIAAACQREKDLWLRAINEARCASPPWRSEPVSSLHSLHLVPSQTSTTPDGNPRDPAEHSVMKRGTSSASVSELSNPLGKLRLSSTRSRPSVSPPTVRYIFSPTDESSILLRRSSETNRIFVDRGLTDVVTDLVTSLRKQTLARQEPLFPPPLPSEPSQTLAIAAKNKLMRRGSVMVARPRSLLVPDSADEDGTGNSLTVRPKSTPTYRKRRSLLPTLSMLYTEPENIGDGSATSSTDFPRPDSASDKSISMSGSAAHSSTTVVSHSEAPHSAPLEGQDNTPHYHRRARSLVGSVRGMMRLGSTKSASTQHTAINGSPEDSSDTGDSTETGSKSSIGRRRVSSAPTSPPVSSSNPFSIFTDCDPQPTPSNSSADASNSPSPSTMDPSSPPTAPESKLDRKKSGSVSAHTDQTLKSRRSFKSFMFYNRLTAVDPA